MFVSFPILVAAAAAAKDVVEYFLVAFAGRTSLRVPHDAVQGVGSMAQRFDLALAIHGFDTQPFP